MKHADATLKIIGLALALLLAASPLRAHESPIDHVDRVVQVYIEEGLVHVVYRFRCEERQVMLQLFRMDKNSDGKISDDERAAWFEKEAKDITARLRLEIDGKPLTLTADSPSLAPDLSQTYHFTAPLPALSPGDHSGKFTDEFSREHPGDYRWRARDVNTNGYEVAATQAPGLEQLGPHPAMIVVNLRIRVTPAQAK
jgi:hypothetical protein